MDKQAELDALRERAHTVTGWAGRSPTTHRRTGWSQHSAKSTV